MFIGREKEIKSLMYLLENPKCGCAVIYGRRRLGKTELVKHCVKKTDLNNIIYQCKESNEYDNTSLITILIEKALGLSHLYFSTFFDAIEFVFEASINKEICLVIDEYPYIRGQIDGCDSKLQALIDKYKGISKLKLILIGSSISIMEEVLEHNSPLYGRFDLSILLKQMDYYDSSKFYSSFSSDDKIRLYSVFGGVPYYNIQIDKRQTVKENIIRLISGTFSGLKDFVETYLKTELRKINNANIVFDTIANGAFHYSDILSKSHIETSTTLNNIIQKLIKMDLVEYICPINDKNNKRKSGYRIKDLSLRFYYNYIYKNESTHNILDDDVFYDTFIKDDFENHFVPNVFEMICKEFLIRKNRESKLNPMLLDIGTYWYDNPKEKKNGQFDVVGQTKDGFIFYECKYRNIKINDEMIKEEISQISKTNLNPVNYGFFSKSGYDIKEKNNYQLYTIDDLFE